MTAILYELGLTAVCPVDGTIDQYDAEILTASVMVPVETINELAASFAGRVIFQEDLAREFHAAVPTPSVVRIIGRHSGVKVTVTVES